MLPTCLKRFINGREDRPGSFISLSLSLSLQVAWYSKSISPGFFFQRARGDSCGIDTMSRYLQGGTFAGMMHCGCLALVASDFRTRTQRGKLASLSLITFSILLLLLLALVEFSPRKFCNSCRLCSMSLPTSFLPPRVFARLVRRKGEETCCAGEEYDEIASTVKLFRCPQPILFSFSLYSFDRPNNQRSRSDIHSYFLLPLVGEAFDPPSFCIEKFRGEVSRGKSISSLSLPYYYI